MTRRLTNPARYRQVFQHYHYRTINTDYIAKTRERWFTYSQSPEQIVAAALNTIPGIVWQHDAQTGM
jgi:hypothetical protein